MNYIKQLQRENTIMRECIADLLTYVNSNKFRDNPMVNKDDINLRIRETETKLFREDLNMIRGDIKPLDYKKGQ